MDVPATGDTRKNLKEIEAAIKEAAILAASKPDHTSRAISAVLYALLATINGGGLADWVKFSGDFGKKMQPLWEAQLEAQNN